MLFSTDPGERKERPGVILDFQNAYVEVLSAYCATDKLRLHHNTEAILEYCDRQKVLRAISAAKALNDFFSLLQAHLAA